jgi:hypothetical protein
MPVPSCVDGPWQPSTEPFRQPSRAYEVHFFNMSEDLYARVDMDLGVKAGKFALAIKRNGS